MRRAGAFLTVAVALGALVGCADGAAGGTQPSWVDAGAAGDQAAECDAAGAEVAMGFKTLIDRAALDPESFQAGATDSGNVLRGLVDNVDTVCSDDQLYATALSDVVVEVSRHTPPSSMFSGIAMREGVGAMCPALGERVAARGETFDPQAQLVCAGR